MWQYRTDSIPAASQPPVTATGEDRAPERPETDLRDPPSDRTSRGRSSARSILAAALLAAAVATTSTLAVTTLTRPAGDVASTASSGQTVASGGTASSGGAASAADPSDEQLTEVIARARSSVVTITSRVAAMLPGRFGGTATGVGSGVIVSSDGYILTNAHVVEGSRSLTVELPDGRRFDATVVETAADHDLALIKIDASGLSAARIGDSSTIKVGQTAIAIGSPLGRYTETVTKGIVSGTGRDITVVDQQSGRRVRLTDLIQTDAAINQGNSGGPLLNADGEVIGINTAAATSAENLGFATPINAAASLLATAGVGSRA
jgi:serine protease Do